MEAESGNPGKDERPSRDMPACWRNETSPPAADMSDWSAYWERLDSRQPIFAAEADDYVSRLCGAGLVGESDRVLDFGCGFGMVAERLAPRVAELGVWDAAANMRSRTLARLGDTPNVLFVDLSAGRLDDRVPAFDVVLVNSVVQYMTEADVVDWLTKWRDMTGPGGRIIVSDIIRPDYAFLPDLMAFIKVCFRKGILLDSLVGGMREIGKYGSLKASKPLLRIAEDTVRSFETRTGLAVEILDENLTYHRGRFTAVFRTGGAGR